jgi:hypothetical protein
MKKSTILGELSAMYSDNSAALCCIQHPRNLLAGEVARQN